LYSSDASYSNNFSTALRSAWSAELSVEFWTIETDCYDPMPKALANASVVLLALLSEVPRSSKIRGVRWWSDERILMPLCLIPNPAPPY
jgi:hypothetical protein